MSEKHNHSLSSINSLLEKKNHCIMIVSLSNEMITYVNQQTEEKTQRCSNALDKKAQSSLHNKHHVIITSSNIFHMKQDCRLLLLSHCQIYIETWRQKFKRWQIVLKYIRTIRNADKMIYNWDWIYHKVLYIQNFSDNVIDNHHLFENELLNL